PDKKLTQEQLNLLGKINELEEKYKLWEKTKEKATKMLWWDDVAKGLAKQSKQSQQTEQSDTETKKEQSADTSSKQAETSSRLVTLSQNGRAWFIHPVSMVNYFSDNKVLFQKGDKDEIIREINIRLAGFGGNVPTDEFTERTENMIKQFQRDYMKVEETGVVDIPVIEAIDKFQEEYPIASYFAQANCKCSTFTNLKEPTCDGFGLNKTNNGKTGKNYASGIEYPGLHRTLFWVLRSIMFYIDSDERYQHLTVDIVSSGYRCWADNIYHNRRSTNHMGKALDIHVIKKEKAKSKHTNDERIVCCDLVRDILTEKTNAEYRWFHSNGIALENSYTRYHPKKGRDNKSIASNWVHYDVRVFESQFLENQFFVKTEKDVNGKYLKELVEN
ncbi:peptidoglycan-binding protein, partial [Gilliamella sp. B2717]|uniref:peptidoglycan-binding domain-containing protein n=1 Tax=Gilliamella sp. B2717 TaxID=2817996 RepID=UPI00226AE735